MRRQIAALETDPRSAALPLYKQVKADILERISKREWVPGRPIPPEQELAAHYRVGIATIRAAIGELVSAKIVDRIQGKGTFVIQHGRDGAIYRFFHVVRDDGVREFPKSELLMLKKVRADAVLADQLRLPRTPDGIWVFRMRNVLAVHDKRLVVSDIAVPAAMFPGLSRKVIEEGGDTIYAVYQKRYGINIIRAPEQLRATRAPSDVARIFSMRPGDPILELSRIAYTFGDVPVEVRRGWVTTEGFYYRSDPGTGD